MFTVVALMAAVTLAVAVAITHGVLRPVLEGRGIAGWRVWQTLAAAPLIWIGSAGTGAGAALAAMGGAGFAAPTASPALAIAGGIVLVGLSAFLLLLGIIALRKLH